MNDIFIVSCVISKRASFLLHHSLFWFPPSCPFYLFLLNAAGKNRSKELLPLGRASCKVVLSLNSDSTVVFFIYSNFCLLVYFWTRQRRCYTWNKKPQSSHTKGKFTGRSFHSHSECFAVEAKPHGTPNHNPQSPNSEGITHSKPKLLATRL